MIRYSMTTFTTIRKPRLGFLFLLIFAITAAFMTSCTHRHTRPGADGADGINGQDGTDGLGFGFVRDIDGSVLAGSYWIGDAALVIPPKILAAIPADEDHHREGVILYLGNATEFYRYYLIRMPAGSYCVVDRAEYEYLGTLDFVADGYLVAVELATLDSLGLLAGLAGSGIAVELDEPATIKLKSHEIRIGAVRIRLYGRD